MKRAVMLLVVLSVFGLPAAAQDAVSDHIGMIGFGYFTSDAPIGIRHWTSPTLGFDAGIGFKTRSEVPILENGQLHTTSFFDFAFEAGVLVALSSDENMILFVRPGVGFVSEQELVPVEFDELDPTVVVTEKKESETTFAVSVMLGAELFLSKLGFPNLSLGGGYGVRLERVSPADDSKDASTSISSDVAEVSIVSSSTLGFHFYF